MNIILHIGTEKTGSTSIQQFLLTNKNQLMVEYVVPACELFLKHVSNNFELVLASNPDPGDLLRFRNCGFSSFRRELKAKLLQLVDTSAKDGKETVVFSSEHMSSRLVNEAHIAALKLLFPASCNFKVIIYLRRQDELLLGIQSEAIKYGGHSLKFSDPFNQGEYDRYGRRYFDYELMVEAWAGVFGEENILIRPFERNQLEQGDVVQDFYSLIPGSSPFSSFQNIPMANKRMSAQALYVISTLNRLGRATPSTIEKTISRLDDYNQTSLVPNELLSEFYSRFERSNRSLAKRYLNRNELFTEKAKKYDYFDSGDEKETLLAMTEFLSRSLGL